MVFPIPILQKKIRAFTLIELMIVITIIAILGSIGFFAFDNALNRGRDSRRKQELKAVQAALSSYYQDKGEYPPVCNPSPCSGTTVLTSDTWEGTEFFNAVKPYLKDQKLPKDPKQASVLENLLASVLRKPKSIANNLLAKLSRFSSKDNPQKNNLAQSQSRGQVLAATTAKPPGTTANDTSGGTIAWASPANTVSSNNLYATVTAGANQTTNYLYLSNFTLAVPVGSTINGIEVRVESKASNSNSYSIGAKLRKGASYVGNTNFTGGNTTTEQTFLKGSTTDLWGSTWTEADINSTSFGVGLYATFGAGITTTTFSVDYVTITVHYTPLPNLLIQQVSLNKPTFTPGEAMTITSTVQNSGSVNISTPFFVGYNTQGPVSTPTCSSLTWSGYDIFSLNAGASDVHNTSTAAPATPGTYQVGIYADENPCQITESNETDNYTYVTYTVAAAPTPTPLPTPSPTPTPTPAPSPSPTPPPVPSPSPSPSPSASPGFSPDPTPGEFDGVPPPPNPPAVLAPNGAIGNTGGTPEDNTSTYNCAGKTDSVYCYIVSADRSYFLLWTRLDNLKDNQSVHNAGTQCRYLPPANTYFNFCIEAQK